ncbi:hypothetical protein CBR_g17794 [Chara braunii]|uniref:Uncharacterized protein n=1 Tax=Chara braunii TaxID=69332 RepID=A0A388KVW0_CHABU|nr:hypothetical protein CBR_g17794 [Chara braunii]|eukprot:GBG74083.1 hypothetical protein CBR_g17794 [Chara braunii]
MPGRLGGLRRRSVFVTAEASGRMAENASVDGRWLFSIGRAFCPPHNRWRRPGDLLDHWNAIQSSHFSFDSDDETDQILWAATTAELQFSTIHL